MSAPTASGATIARKTAGIASSRQSVSPQPTMPSCVSILTTSRVVPLARPTPRECFRGKASISQWSTLAMRDAEAVDMVFII